MATSTPAEVVRDSKAERLERYLHRRAMDGGFYFKSREITDEVDLSAKEIGALIATLRETTDPINIERWAIRAVRRGTSNRLDIHPPTEVVDFLPGVV